MDEDVRELLESAEFRQYHQERQAPRFNVFDVLRYSEYEIRHSNVLAWLLTPGETHGLGDKFLRRFLESLDPRPGSLKADFGTEPVKVESVKREFHFADVAVFLDDEERTLLAIENKVVGLHDEAIDQTRKHVERLRKECPGRAIHGVLLTASGQEDGATIVARRQEEVGVPMSYVSWHRIREIITRLYPDDFAADPDVRSFVPQYREVVERIIRPGGSLVEKLLDKYGSTFERLSGANGAAAIEQVDKCRRESLEALIGAFRQKPDEQRSEMQDYLKGKGIATTKSPSAGLNWESRGGSSALKLGWSLIWSIGFSYSGVELTLHCPPWIKGTAKENVFAFMKKNPTERWLPTGEAGRYRMEHPDKEYGYLIVYRNTLLDSRRLADLSFRESTELLRKKLDAFFARGSDYERIESYFRCLAFDAREGMPPQDAERQPQE